MAKEIERHFNKVAKNYDFYKKRQKYYYSNLKDLLLDLIGESKNVLEIGCGTGDLVAYLKPNTGYGMDISSEMIKIAKVKHKNQKILRFRHLCRMQNLIIYSCPT